MKKFLELIKIAFSKSFLKIFATLVSAIDKIASFLKSKEDRKVMREKQKIEAKKTQIEQDVCDNGTLEDLLDIRSKEKLLVIFLVLLSPLFSGCISHDVEVTVTKSWEGHYMTVEDFQKRTLDVKLQKGESIWVLSNKTLKKILSENRE